MRKKRCPNYVNIWIIRHIKNYEVIFVDDGSADRSNIILQEYSSSKPKCQVITLKENVGIFRACQIGLQRAEGRFVCFFQQMICFFLGSSKLVRQHSTKIKRLVWFSQLQKSTTNRAIHINRSAHLWNQDTIQLTNI